LEILSAAAVACKDVVSLSYAIANRTRCGSASTLSGRAVMDDFG
jgi:hypothetical protein